MERIFVNVSTDTNKYNKKYNIKYARTLASIKYPQTFISF